MVACEATSKNFLSIKQIGGFYFMQNPDKPFKTYDEQVSILKSRNVYIKNEEIGAVTSK